MAYGIRSQKFLCCLPVRLGVFVLSILQFLGYGILAVIFWFATFSHKVHFDKAQKASVVIAAIHSSLMAIISLGGFIGSIFRKKGLVALYSSTLQFLFGATIALTVFYVISWFTGSKDKFINQCINGSTDQDVINACHHVNEIRFIGLGFLIVIVLVHMYEFIIVARYVIQLQEEDEEKWRLRTLKSNTYGNVSARESIEGLTQPQAASYPYSDAQHSFGPGPSNV